MTIPGSIRAALPALLCVALLGAWAAGARAQAPDDDEAAEASGEPPADEPAPGEPGSAGSGPGEPTDGAGDETAGDAEGDPASGPAVPAQATSSVVVDDRQAALEREQAAMMEESEPEVADPEPDDDEGEGLDHEYQVGIRLGAGVPFMFGIRYGDGPRCSRDAETFCAYVGSGVVDGELSFGVTPDLEITAMGRVGMVGVEPTEERAIQLGLGIRSYLAPESLFKFFLGAKLMLDLTPDGGVAEWGDVDVGVRGEVGVQLDIVRYFGLYAQLGVNILFLRAFGVSPDLTGGFQVRFP
ncbi:MAG TPA: hypothetical protein RMH99_25515 [Sandaracinaceae bacterium LLY-WYZ-13_1]|nr:hypothetical protein [Sandaracinaceae bacterium LLY-WYZ-13_1]